MRQLNRGFSVVTILLALIPGISQTINAMPADSRLGPTK